jgi:hypothetical protein
MRQWSFWKLSKKYNRNFTSRCSFWKLSNTTWKLSKTWWCMHGHPYTKNKNHSLLDGRRPLQANGGISKMWSRWACAPHHLTAAVVCTASRVASKSASFYIYCLLIRALTYHDCLEHAAVLLNVSLKSQIMPHTMSLEPWLLSHTSFLFSLGNYYFF